MRRPLAMIVAAVSCLVVLYVAAAIGVFVFQRDLLYRPDAIDLPPAVLGLDDVRVERIATADDVSLVSWFRPGPGRKLILFLHGTGGSLARRSLRFAQLARFGSVLAIDYRGFGGSAGSPSEDGLLRDAEAAYAAALAKGYAPADCVVLGESLGSGVALMLAARHPVGGLVLAGAYDSVRAIAAERFWMFPVRWALRDPFDAAAVIGRVSVPILVLHGTDDAVIPLRHAEALVAAAGPNVTLVPIPGGPHLVLADPDADHRLADWMSRLP